MNFYYKIYGMVLSSTRSIGLLEEQPYSPVDLNVIWTTNSKETPDDSLPWVRIITRDLAYRKGISLYHASTVEGVYKKFCFREINLVLEFILHPVQNKLWVIYDKQENENDLDSYFVGPVLGSILRLKNVICLHASVICIDEKAVVIMGNKRSGKSTTAAAFTQLGFSILADDLAVISSINGVFFVESGYSSVRLRPASLEAIHSKGDENFPLVYSFRNSRYADVRNNFHKSSLPLGSIYLLNNSSSYNSIPTIQTIPELEKIVRLNEHTFGNYVVTRELRKNEFHVLGKLASTIPFYSLVFAPDLQMLRLQCETIIINSRKTIHN